jgi:DNA-binding HxlR family transcriptional regulator
MRIVGRLLGARPRRPDLALTGAIRQVWTKMIVWRPSRGKALPNKAAIMANTQSAPTCGCPVAAFQKMISWKYKLRIMWDLQHGPRRYGEIRTGLLRGAAGSGEIAPRVLSRELKALAATGLIDRKDFGLVPPKVEYRLTRKGRSFIPVIAAIRAWGARHLTQIGSGETLDGAAG